MIHTSSHPNNYLKDGAVDPWIFFKSLHSAVYRYQFTRKTRQACHVSSHKLWLGDVGDLCWTRLRPPTNWCWNWSRISTERGRKRLLPEFLSHETAREKSRSSMQSNSIAKLTNTCAFHCNLGWNCRTCCYNIYCNHISWLMIDHEWSIHILID